MIETALTLLIAAPVMLFLHELSHVIAVKLLGGTVHGFYPYPHYNDDRFYLGRVRYRLENNRWVHISPLIMDIALVPLTLSTFPLLTIWPAIDALEWIRSYLGISLPWSKNTEPLDGHRFRHD